MLLPGSALRTPGGRGASIEVPVSEGLAPFQDPDAGIRRWQAREACLLAGSALAVAATFMVTDLDLWAAERFYHPGLADPWPLANHLLSRVLYRSAPWITASLALAGTAFLVAGLARRGARRLRLYGLFIVLTVALGPGLLVNGVLKDHWGRPRPRQVLALGGDYPYVPPLLRTAAPGKSFPCGHCSVAFLYGLGWWILRRRRPVLAGASLASGLALGILLGLGRMAAGAHFLSDTLVSGIISYGVAHILYFHVLRVPLHEDRGHPALSRMVSSPRRRALSVAAALAAGAGVVGGGLLASPHFLDLAGTHPLDEGPGQPRVLLLDLDRTDLDIRFSDAPGAALASRGWINGFGLPTNTLEAGWTLVPGREPALAYRLAERGWFTEVEGVLHLTVPARAFRRIVVRLQSGDVRVHAPPPGAPLPEMDAISVRGRVNLPVPPPGPEPAAVHRPEAAAGRKRP